MSDYNKTISFGAKDSLPSGNPAKRILGSEVDEELVAISSAISSKLDKFATFSEATPSIPTNYTVFFDGTSYKKTLISNLSTPALTGSIIAFAGQTTPSGYLECNGSNVSRSTYADLFTAIGVTWGAGDGTTTFTLPDLRRRTLIGKNGTAGAGSPGITMGSTGGSETRTLTTANLPSHAHLYDRASEAAGTTIGGDNSDIKLLLTSTSTSYEGSGTAFNIMQPSAVVGFFIKI